MTILVTGSAGHLGEALMRHFANEGLSARGVDIQPSSFTQHVGSITDPAFVSNIMAGITGVLHTATLHKPHVATHSRQDFIDTNISATLNLLEAARDHGVRRFIYTSTTSAFGDSLKNEPGSPAIWVNEQLASQHKNIYGVTKTAAEGLCELFANKFNVPALVLRTSRFFPEEDDNRLQRSQFSDSNLKVNELLHRRADIHDVVTAHLAALEKVEDVGFHRLIISATPPFNPEDAVELAHDAAAVVHRWVPLVDAVYQEKKWRLYDVITRVYDNSAARQVLDWEPEYTFARVLERLAAGDDFRSPMALAVGSKGYHAQSFASLGLDAEDGPYPVE